MGSYIYAYAEKRHNGQWMPAHRDGVVWENEHPARVWDTQSYAMYGWLADVRNYSKVPPVIERRGLPVDVSSDIANLSEANWAYGHSWIGLDELLCFDYNATFEDRRTPNGAGPYGTTYPEGMGTVKPYREIFAPVFWEDIEKLKALDAPENIRIVFFFD